MRHTYVRYDRTAGEQCQQVTPLGCVALAYGFVSLGLHSFLRLAHALYCR